MCGITGFFNQENCQKKTLKSLKLTFRGEDGTKTLTLKNGVIGHKLHAIIDNIPQPLTSKKSVLITNCEIYNWEKLNKKYKLKTINDAQTLHKLLDLKGLKILKELDGVYAFCWIKKDEIFLSRDILGVNPLWYSITNGLSFSSNKNSLIKNDVKNVFELNPRQTITYNIKTKKVSVLYKKFLKIPKIKTNPYKKLINVFEKAVMKRVPRNQKIGILLSGGIDSTSIAWILIKNKIPFTAYHAVVLNKKSNSEDYMKTVKFCKKYDIPLQVISPNTAQIQKMLPKLIEQISSPDPIKIGVGLVTYYATSKAKTDGVKVMMSGSGSEEIFHSYKRHEHSKNLDHDSINELLSFYEKNSYRDNTLSLLNNTELRLPFLDYDLIKTAWQFEPQKRKFKNCFRDALSFLDFDNEYRLRAKKSAQYPSGFDWSLKKLAKKNGYKNKSEYLQSLTKIKDSKLLALVSGGKDSMLALHIMTYKGYEIKAMGVIHSKNPDSYMYHTPNTHVVKQISDVIKISLLEQTTTGVKEKELLALKKLFIKAKKSLGVEGVVSGAVFSSYQKNRIISICEELGLKFFTPLWNTDQIGIVKTISKEPWKVIIIKIASDGLDESWLGKEINKKTVEELIKLEKTHGVHPAGEGGEYESLTINAPLYTKPITYTILEKKMENENTGEILLK